MNLITIYVIEYASWMLGDATGQALFKKLLPSDQIRTEEALLNTAPITSKKIYLLIPQLFVLGASITIYLAAPKASLSFFATYHCKNPYLHSIALNAFHGFLVASTVNLGDYIIQKVGDKTCACTHTHAQFTSMLNLTSMSVLATGYLCRFSYEQILFTRLFIDKTTRHFYALSPSVAAEMTQKIFNTPFGRAASLFETGKMILQQHISVLSKKVQSCKLF